MAPEILITMAVTASLTWGIPKVLNRVVGTDYRTEQACQECDTRRAVHDIRRMVQELAIKAGVPTHEALKVGAELGQLGGKR